VIKLTEDQRDHTIMTDCETVHVSSTKRLEKTDHVIVENVQYQETKIKVNQVVATNFTISMESSSSTTLSFGCTQWGEWKTFDNDGTCRTFVMEPLHHWQNTKGVLKYKRNTTCCKFSHHNYSLFKNINTSVNVIYDISTQFLSIHNANMTSGKHFVYITLKCIHNAFGKSIFGK